MTPSWFLLKIYNNKKQQMFSCDTLLPGWGKGIAAPSLSSRYCCSRPAWRLWEVKCSTFPYLVHSTVMLVNILVERIKVTDFFSCNAVHLVIVSRSDFHPAVVEGQSSRRWKRWKIKEVLFYTVPEDYHLHKTDTEKA